MYNILPSIKNHQPSKGTTIGAPSPRSQKKLSIEQQAATLTIICIKLWARYKDVKRFEEDTSKEFKENVSLMSEKIGNLNKSTILQVKKLTEDL